MPGGHEPLDELELRLGRHRRPFGLQTVTRRDLDDRDPVRQSRAKRYLRAGHAPIVAASAFPQSQTGLLPPHLGCARNGAVISAEYAWVAGLFEGEGSVIVARKGQHQRRLDIANCQADVLERVREITGRGAVRIDANPNRPPHHQVRLVWQVWSWLDICEVADHIYPLLGVRRRERIRDLFAWPP